MIKEFPNKTWKRRAVDYLIKKIDLDGSRSKVIAWIEKCENRS